MSNDLEKVQGIMAVSAAKTPSGELTFTFPEVLDAIRLCTANAIAVLGIEVFKIQDGEYLTTKISPYSYDKDTQDALKTSLDEGWAAFVRANNFLASQFVAHYRAGDDHVYVLSAASYNEHEKVQTMKETL